MSGHDHSRDHYGHSQSEGPEPQADGPLGPSTLPEGQRQSIYSREAKLGIIETAHDVEAIANEGAPIYIYPGIEALNIPGHSEDKQVVAVHKPLAPNGYASLSPPDPASACLFWKWKRWIFTMVALLVFVILAAVLIPVGLVILKSDDDNPSTSNASASATANPDDPVLKGTRLATMESRSGDTFLYYQSGDGGLHFISMSDMKVW